MRGRLHFGSAEFVDATQGAIQLCRALVKQDVHKRLTAGQALQHAWFKRKAPKRKLPQLNTDMLRHLKAFRTLNKFKRAANHVIASLLKDQEIASAREAFQSLDKDGDGFVSVAELCEELERSHPDEIRCI